jgi:hypothetical protein
MKNKYLDKQEYYVDNLWFRHQGNIYRGNGVLRWSPEKGFHLVAKILDRHRPSKVEFRSIEIVKPFRIMFEITTTWEKTYAMTPLLNIRDSDLHFNQSLTINFGRAIFFHYIGHENPAMKEKTAWLRDVRSKPKPDISRLDPQRIQIGREAIW